MKINVKQDSKKYYGHIYEHIELGGIYQIAFKAEPQV